MIKKRLFIFVLLTICLLALGAQAQNKLAVAVEMRLIRMDYAMAPGMVGATFDFNVLEVQPGYAGLGYLNAVTDLNEWFGDGLEWICQNIPVHVSEDMTAVPHSVWFDPTIFDVDFPGAHDVYPSGRYPVWAIITDQELVDPPDWSTLDFWDYSYLPSGASIWGLYDTLLGPGGEVADPPVSTEPAKTKGETASPCRTTMPDIAQKSMECGPTSCANSLLWLAKKHGFGDKLPRKQDDLIKGLMKAMTGSDARPFPGLAAGWMRAGKIKYAKEQGLPIIVKGGNTDADAKGAKAFDFIKKEFDAGEDVEMLINWPGGGAHWVTVVGYAVKGDRLFVKVNDPDDGKTGTVTWELDRNGNFINPRGTMNRAVSESFVPQDDIPIPGISAGGHHEYGGFIMQDDDGTKTFVEDSSSDPAHAYDLATNTIHMQNEDNDNEMKIVRLTAIFDVPMDNDRRNPRFNPQTPGKWATINTTSQIVVRNKKYSYGGPSGEYLQIKQKWKLVPNPKSEDIDMSAFFVGTHPLRLVRFTVDTWCLPQKVKVEQTDGDTTVTEDGDTDTIEITLTQPPAPGTTVELVPILPPGSRLEILPGPPLGFDESNWDTPQVLRIGAIDDPEPQTIDIDIVSLSLVSSDPIFVGSYPAWFPVTIIDNECGPLGRPSADLNGDCCVNFKDLAIMADQWLDCTLWLTPIIVLE